MGIRYLPVCLASCYTAYCICESAERIQMTSLGCWLQEAILIPGRASGNIISVTCDEYILNPQCVFVFVFVCVFILPIVLSLVKGERRPPMTVSAVYNVYRLNSSLSGVVIMKVVSFTLHHTKVREGGTCI
jgi:hypothetical protein